jgi:hypothetical protein
MRLLKVASIGRETLVVVSVGSLMAAAALLPRLVTEPGAGQLVLPWMATTRSADVTAPIFAPPPPPSPREKKHQRAPAVISFVPRQSSVPAPRVQRPVVHAVYVPAKLSPAPAPRARPVLQPRPHPVSQARFEPVPKPEAVVPEPVVVQPPVVAEPAAVAQPEPTPEPQTPVAATDARTLLKTVAVESTVPAPQPTAVVTLTVPTAVAQPAPPTVVLDEQTDDSPKQKAVKEKKDKRGEPAEETPSSEQPVATEPSDPQPLAADQPSPQPDDTHDNGGGKAKGHDKH